MRMFRNEIENLNDMLSNTSHMWFLKQYKHNIISQTYILNKQIWLFTKKMLIILGLLEMLIIIRLIKVANLKCSLNDVGEIKTNIMTYHISVTTLMSLQIIII